MDKIKIFLEDGNEKLVNGIFYLYNLKYYFLYTLNELDENGYVKLYLVKVGKETTTTEKGSVETGNMVGIEIPTDEEWKEVQGSISKIVNSKKTKVDDKDIQYLSLDMLTNLKVVSKKTFRLISTIVENDFGINLSESLNTSQDNVIENDPELNRPIEDSKEQEIDNITLENKEDFSNENVESNVEIPTEVEKSEDLVEIQNDESEMIQSVEPKEELNESEQVDENNQSESNEESDSEYDNPDIIIDYRTRFFEEQEKNKHLKEEIEKLNKKLEDIDKVIKGN